MPNIRKRRFTCARYSFGLLTTLREISFPGQQKTDKQAGGLWLVGPFEGKTSRVAGSWIFCADALKWAGVVVQARALGRCVNPNACRERKSTNAVRRSQP